MSEVKPREFFFEYMSESNEYQQLSDKPPYVRDSSFELIHVIEYSAYNKAIEALKWITDWGDVHDAHAKKANSVLKELCEV